VFNRRLGTGSNRLESVMQCLARLLSEETFRSRLRNSLHIREDRRPTSLEKLVRSPFILINLQYNGKNLSGMTLAMSWGEVFWCTLELI
jgi:hypothetical protein